MSGSAHLCLIVHTAQCIVMFNSAQLCSINTLQAQTESARSIATGRDSKETAGISVSDVLGWSLFSQCTTVM